MFSVLHALRIEQQRLSFWTDSPDCPDKQYRGSDINSNVHVYELLENPLQHIGLDFVEYDIVTLDHRQHHVTDIHNHVMNDESFDQVEYNHVSFQFSYLMELFLNLIQPKDVDAVRLSANYLDAEENHDSNILKMIQFTVLFSELLRYLALQSRLELADAFR